MIKMHSERINIAILTSGLLALIFITAINLNPPLFDEVLFLTNVELFSELGLSEKFLVEMYDQAPGPLYQLIHYPLSGITGLEAPGVRLVNVFALILIICILGLILRASGKREDSWNAMYLLAAPMIWQVSGMALTEIPAMLMATISVLFLIYAAMRHPEGGKMWIFAGLSGVFLGLSILGRSTFLVLIAPYLMMIYYYRKSFPVLAVAIALLMSLPVFFIWEGLMPPAQQYIGEKGLSWWHGILAFAYMGIVAAIIAPRWFVINRILFYALAGFFILFSTANYFWLHSYYMPMSEFLFPVLGAEGLVIYGYVVSGILAVAAMHFGLSGAIHLWRRRCDPYFVFFAVACFLVLATCFKVTHLFSSRYVAQAAIFFIPLIPRFRDRHWSLPFRILLALVIGFISLNTYSELI